MKKMVFLGFIVAIFSLGACQNNLVDRFQGVWIDEDGTIVTFSNNRVEISPSDTIIHISLKLSFIKYVTDARNRTYALYEPSNGKINLAFLIINNELVGFPASEHTLESFKGVDITEYTTMANKFKRDKK